jgi:CAAX amino terminal protease family.
LPTRRNLGEAALVLLALAGIAAVAFRLIPPGALQGEEMNTAAYTGWPRNMGSLMLIFVVEMLNRALPEEVFFRGWLGGCMVRRFGFWMGNTLQALVFLFPHLLLLTVTMALWPITILQFAAGWLQGWLRWRSESVIPSTMVHAITNILGALPVLG